MQVQANVTACSQKDSKSYSILLLALYLRSFVRRLAGGLLAVALEEAADGDDEALDCKADDRQGDADLANVLEHQEPGD